MRQLCSDQHFDRAGFLEDLFGGGCPDEWLGATARSLPTNARSAGRTCSATSPPTAKAWPRRKSSARPASASPNNSSPPGRSTKHDGDRRALKRRVAPLQHELRALLKTNAAKQARNRYTRTISNNLLKLWPALWTFIETDGVEPTNNHAERGLRGAGRGRDSPSPSRLGPPPAQIPACASNAPGSCLGFWRRSVRLAKDAGCAARVAIARRGDASASRSCWPFGCGAEASAAMTV